MGSRPLPNRGREGGDTSAEPMHRSSNSAVLEKPRRAWLATLLIVGAIVLFLIANRAAYKGFFQADSIESLNLMRQLDYDYVYRPLFFPNVFSNNFRPVGECFFKLMGSLFGLWFPPYVAALQIVHIANAALVGCILRRLKLPLIAACVGAVFFAFNMALFSVFWEPMYVFDLLCGTFCLLSLLTYIDGHWVVSFLLFWLAYRAKENAIALPAVIFAYEWLLGQRRWKRLIPFFSLSLILGVQGLWNNMSRNSDYTLRFDPASIWHCIAFYSSQILLLRYAGLAVLALPLLLRNSRMWFGVAAFCALLMPMLLLPGRLSSAYLYVPMTGAAICVATLVQWQPKPVIAALVLLWIPWNFINLRTLRRSELARANRSRMYVATLIQAIKNHPGIRTFFYHDLPIERYAIAGIVEFVQPDRLTVKAFDVSTAGQNGVLQSKPAMLLDWEPTPVPGSLIAIPHTNETPETSYITMDRRTPVWQLESGWNLAGRGPYRWISPSATARLVRPSHARRFELTANVSPEMLRYVHRSHLRVFLDGHMIGEQDFEQPGVQVLRWKIDDAPMGIAHVAMEAQPGFQTDQGNGPLGLSVGNFGFVTP